MLRMDVQREKTLGFQEHPWEQYRFLATGQRLDCRASHLPVWPRAAAIQEAKSDHSAAPGPGGARSRLSWAIASRAAPTMPEWGPSAATSMRQVAGPGRASRR